MDSDCERLVDEMWQSYLCEQNIASFYEPSVSNITNTQSGTQAISQEDLDAINTNFTDVLEGWDPLEHLFDLLEEILLFEEHEVEYTFFHQSNADPKTGHQEISKKTCRNTTTENAKPTPYNKNEMENEVMETDHDTSMLKRSKKRRNNTTSDHNDGKKKKTISDE